MVSKGRNTCPRIQLASTLTLKLVRWKMDDLIFRANAVKREPDNEHKKQNSNNNKTYHSKFLKMSLFSPPSALVPCNEISLMKILKSLILALNTY